MKPHLRAVPIFFVLILSAYCECAEEGLHKAFDPLVNASNQRRDAAQKLVSNWKAKAEELASLQKSLDKRIGQAAEKLGLPNDPQAKAHTEKLKALTEKFKSLEAVLKGMDFNSFATVAQLVQHDQLSDEAIATKQLIQTEKISLAALTRERVKAQGGADLVDEWNSVNEQLIAASNETVLTQMRRDEAVRAESGFLKALQPVPAGKQPAPTEIVSVSVPALPDGASRMDEFKKRRSEESIRQLGQRFFSQMSLDGEGLRETHDFVQAGRYSEAMDAYKRYFFKKLAAFNEDAEGGTEGGEDDESVAGESRAAGGAFPPPSAGEIEDALSGIVRHAAAVKGSQLSFEAKLGLPGSICWAFAEQKTLNDEVKGPLILEFCRKQGQPGLTASALLHSYALGGPKEHLERWTEVLDDWSLNWQKDVERSSLPLRDYNLLCVFRIKESLAKLKTVAQLRPSFIEELPASTLARLLMGLNEEYLGAAIRLGRAGLYNFRIMALGGMIPTSLKFQEFHAHQWALREGWRQTDNNFVYKIRRDGANFEFANDGHENTDQALMMPFKAVRSWQAQPVWTEPFWAEEFTDNFLSNTRYWIHNLKQNGYGYRLSARNQRIRYLGATPEYKVNMLGHEDEVRRRLWAVFKVGKPEEPPRVLSESMCHQGYYYLRSGWKPEDSLLYFQSIGQPILSGREDNTGFSLYGQAGITLLAPAPVVDGRTQNAHYGLIQNPGGKAPFATYGKPDAVKQGRFYTGAHFDLVEGAFEGVYQYHRPSTFFDVFGTYGYEASFVKAQSRAQREGKPFSDEPIRDVKQSRQILSLREKGAYIVTDRIESESPRKFTQHFTVYTPVRKDNLKKRLELLRQENSPSVSSDAKLQMLSTRNFALPNLQMRHFGTIPVAFTLQDEKRTDAIMAGGDLKQILKSFSKCDQQTVEPSQCIQFSQKVAVDWKSQGRQVLVTLVLPQASDYSQNPSPNLIQSFTPLNAPGTTAGFSGKLADGTEVRYLAGYQATDLDLGRIRAKASALLLIGERGIALNCSQIAAADTATTPPSSDFTFHLENGRIVIGENIYAPIKPIAISPAANVFTDNLSATLSCETPEIDIRYTLDGSKPTPQSPLYTGPILIDRTSRLKARGFRRGVKEDIWQQDGTHATVVYSAVYRKEEPMPARNPGKTSLGLQYEYFEGIWTELLVRSMTYPAKESGVVTKLLDVTPRKTDGAFGMRYSGFLEIPKDGVYTFYAPPEYTFPDRDSGYDLRVFVDGKEWIPAVRWQGHGTWSIALKKGLHDFKVVFVDMRLRPHKIELMWGFPHPEFTSKGTPELRLSGPDFPQQPIPEAILTHP